MTEAELWHMQLLAVENTLTGLENAAIPACVYFMNRYAGTRRPLNRPVDVRNALEATGTLVDRT